MNDSSDFQSSFLFWPVVLPRINARVLCCPLWQPDQFQGWGKLGEVIQDSFPSKGLGAVFY